MLNASGNRVITAILAIIIAGAAPLNAWLFDRGLEDRIGRMRSMFRNKDLPTLYRQFVDDRCRADIGKLIDRMRADRKNNGSISRKLGFRNKKAYLDAEKDAVVDRFFDVMIHPGDSKLKPINNASYLRLALLLSLLFAHLDDGMELEHKNITDDGARLIYAREGFRAAAAYVFRNDNWFLTTDNFLNR
jgi:hypothetical protein